MIPSSDSIHVASQNSPIPVLRDAAIYGPNASGKSNLIKALDLFKILFLTTACWRIIVMMLSNLTG